MDPYTRLGLSPGASNTDVKKAHRRLIREVHPDLHGNTPENAKKFREIQQAYEIIIRGEYIPPQPTSSYKPTPTQTTQNTPPNDPPPKNTYGFHATKPKNPFYQQTTNNDTTLNEARIHQVYISFLESLQGTRCNIREESYSATINIPAGVKNREIIHIPNGISNIHGEKRDCDIRIHIHPQSHYHRIDNDVVIYYKVTPKELKEGKETHVNMPNGNSVRINIPPNSIQQQSIRIPRLGFPYGGWKRGNLRVILTL